MPGRWVFAMATGAPSSPASDDGASPIVGRAAEQVLLKEQLVSVRNGHGRFCILSGEAGIGKTTLVREMIAVARDLDMLVLVGQCYDLMAAPPYGLWLDLAGTYRATGMSLVDAALPPVLASGELRLISSQSEVFEQVRSFLAEVSSARPTLVVLEDVHWADPVSLELVRHVATQIAHLRVCLVMTYRLDELNRQNPLYRQLPALIRESGGLRIDLDRLSRDALNALVVEQYPMPAPDVARLVEFVAEHSDGNPFFAVELLRALEHRGSHGGLSRGPDGWRLGELAPLVVPTLVRQVIDLRIERLGPDLREPLAVAAVIGQDVQIALWQNVSGLPLEDLISIVDLAVDWHLVVADADGTRIRFVHALTREALYEGILPPRRRVLHREVAEALISLSNPDPDPVAFHLHRAGDPRAVEWLNRAGERAQRAYAWLTAWDRFSTAATLLADVPGEAYARASLLYRCGRLLRYADADRGIRDIRLARKLAEAAGAPLLAAEAMYSQGLLHCFADEWTEGVIEITAGIERLEALPADEARGSWSTVNWLADALPAIEMAMSSDTDLAAASLAEVGINHRRGGLPWFLAASGNLRLARREADDFLGHVEGTDPGPLVLSASGHARFGQAIALAASGDPTGAKAAFRAARDIYDRLDHHAVIGFALLTELQDVVMRYETTDLERRRSLADEARAALERAGGALPSDISMRRAHLPLMWIEGRWDEALELASESDSHGNYVLRRPVTLAAAQVHYAQGHADMTMDVIRKILPDGPDAVPGSAVLADGLMLQLLAMEIALDEGELETARRWLAANRRWLEWSGAVAGRTEQAVAQARLDMAVGDLGEAMSHAELAVMLSSNPLQPLARLHALRLRGVAGAALGDTGRVADDFREALSLADACAAPFERARTLVEIANAGIDTRKAPDRDVMPDLTEAREIAVRLNAAPLLSRIDALMARKGDQNGPGIALTARERDVLALAARGLTDAEIGERLFISHRTVSQHLRSVYGKLGVHSRTAAARFAVEHDIV